MAEVDVGLEDYAARAAETLAGKYVGGWPAPFGKKADLEAMIREVLLVIGLGAASEPVVREVPIRRRPGALSPEAAVDMLLGPEEAEPCG